MVESRSFTADEALAGEARSTSCADDLEALLAAIDGRAVSKTEGAALTLRTAGAAVRELRMTPFQRLLSALAHPNIAYILLTLGFLGLYFELAHPGRGAARGGRRHLPRARPSSRSRCCR